VPLGLAVATGALLVVPARPQAAQAPPGPVAVFPIPGSQLAPPGAQIAFRGIHPAQLRAARIEVTGSHTGAHRGVLEFDSDGDGGSFIPTSGFAPGETVTVSTSLNIDGAIDGTYQFTVAYPAGQVPYKPHLVVQRARGDVWKFRSSPGLTPASVRLIKRTAAAGTDDIFLAPQYGPLQDGPEILNSYGQLVWFQPVKTGDVATDFRVQSYRGRPVLTWFQGYTDAGAGVGEDVIYNRSYRRVAVVHAADGLSADLHEFEITPQGTALITAVYPVYWNATSVGGSAHEIVFDAVVQEIDIPTGLVLFQWDSLDHVPLTASYDPPPVQGRANGYRNPYDYFHINSVDQDYDGNLIISGRNVWAAYKVNIQTGAIMWTLGGRNSSFLLAPGSLFAFQHDVRAVGAGDQYISVFDDGGGPPQLHESRGLELALNFQTMTTQTVVQDDHSPPLDSDFEGSDQELPNSDAFIGWGQQPYFTEFNSSGREILDGRFVGYTGSYRAYRFAWSGQPADRPAVAALSRHRTTTVYASWNGATDVAAWRVLSGSSPRALGTARIARKTNFETAIAIRRAGYVQVQALSDRGHVLASSAIVS
jgi:Arylsulfotransferase (ASST)